MQTDETFFKGAQQTPPPPPKTETKTEAKPEPTPILTNSKGMMMPANHKQVMTIIGQVDKGGGFPQRFKTWESKIAVYNMATQLTMSLRCPTYQ